MSKVTDKKVLALPEVKKMLDAISEESLSQFQRRVVDYVKKFSRMDEEKATKLLGELEKLGLSKGEMVQIVSCLPESPEELRVFLLGSRKIVSPSLIEETAKVLEKYRR